MGSPNGIVFNALLAGSAVLSTKSFGPVFGHYGRTEGAVRNLLHRTLVKLSAQITS